MKLDSADFVNRFEDLLTSYYTLRGSNVGVFARAFSELLASASREISATRDDLSLALTRRLSAFGSLVKVSQQEGWSVDFYRFVLRKLFEVFTRFPMTQKGLEEVVAALTGIHPLIYEHFREVQCLDGQNCIGYGDVTVNTGDFNWNTAVEYSGGTPRAIFFGPRGFWIASSSPDSVTFASETETTSYPLPSSPTSLDGFGDLVFCLTVSSLLRFSGSGFETLANVGGDKLVCVDDTSFYVLDGNNLYFVRGSQVSSTGITCLGIADASDGRGIWAIQSSPFALARLEDGSIVSTQGLAKEPRGVSAFYDKVLVWFDDNTATFYDFGESSSFDFSLTFAPVAAAVVKSGFLFLTSSQIFRTSDFVTFEEETVESISSVVDAKIYNSGVGVVLDDTGLVLYRNTVSPGFETYDKGDPVHVDNGEIVEAGVAESRKQHRNTVNVQVFYDPDLGTPLELIADLANKVTPHNAVLNFEFLPTSAFVTSPEGGVGVNSSKETMVIDFDEVA